MKTFIYAIIILLGSSTFCLAQESISATLIDSTSLKPVSYATITLNNSYGVISNEHGKFQLNLKKKLTDNDSIFISCLGYKSLHIPTNKSIDSVIFLSAKTFELNETIVTSKNYTAEEIIKKVKEGLQRNYDFGYSKSKLFYRESGFTNILKSNITIEKTTIPEFNQSFIDSIVTAIPKNSDSYTEILGTMYGKINDDESQKLDVIKASRLYDKNSEITFEAFEKRINTIFRKNIKRDSYFKIKSGIFGSKQEMDTAFYDNTASKDAIELIEEQKKRELKEKENFLKYKRHSITKLEQNSFIFDNTDLNFLEKSNRYTFELEDFAYLNNNYVYKITFTPKRRENYKGTMYINPINFSVERIDYENTKPLKNFSLLGITYNFYMQKGTLVYTKNNSGKYALKFAEVENGYKSGVKRPIKIIEKNKNVKGRRKQNEIAGKIHFVVSNITKKELVLFKNESILKNEFDQFKEKASIKPIYLPAYDPEFWKGHNVIEPNEAIKSFKSIE